MTEFICIDCGMVALFEIEVDPGTSASPVSVCAAHVLARVQHESAWMSVQYVGSEG